MIKPRDVFVLFLGGHGRSIMGSGWFFLPPDLTLDGRQTIEANGIGQDKWQKWLAKIPASKSVLILDACESGATEAFRGSDRERETVMSQLEHATGRNIIAATPNGKAAYEGYRNHGLLTYAVLDALHKPEGGGADIIRIYGLAAHVSAKVIEISTREFGVIQKPEPILRDDFPLGVRTSLSALFSPTTAPVAGVLRPTHIVTRAVQVHDRPADDAPVSRELRKNTLVSVTQTAGPWSFVEKDGERIGYVRNGALEEVN